MKKNETKVTNLVATKVAEQLEGIKNSKTTKASAPKATRPNMNLVSEFITRSFKLILDIL